MTADNPDSVKKATSDVAMSITNATHMPPNAEMGTQTGGTVQLPIPVWQDLKEIAVAIERLPEFIWRPDLNADIIGTLDLLARKLHELSDEVQRTTHTGRYGVSPINGSGTP